MSLKPEGCACWSERCLMCGVLNYGCVRFDIYCGNCGGKINNLIYSEQPTLPVNGQYLIHTSEISNFGMRL